MYVETLIVTIFLPVFLFLWKIMFTAHARALKKIVGYLHFKSTLFIVTFEIALK